jgi:hypothetical protein
MAALQAASSATTACPARMLPARARSGVRAGALRQFVCAQKTTESGKKLQRCGGCRALAYCETAHQHADWRARHKAECAALKVQSDAAGRQRKRGRVKDGMEE